MEAQSESGIKPARKVWRSKSVVNLLNKSPFQLEREEMDIPRKASRFQKTGLLIVVVIVFMLYLVGLDRIQRLYSRLLWWICIGVLALLFRLAAPEVIGRVLTFAVTRFALNNELALSFKGVRIAPWFDIGDIRQAQEEEPCVARPRARYEAVDQEGQIPAQVGDEHQPVDVSSAMRHLGLNAKKKSPLADAFLQHSGSLETNPDQESEVSTPVVAASSKKRQRQWSLWHFLRRCRLCLEIRVKRFAMSQPDRDRSGSNWCRDRFVTGTEIEIVASMNLLDAIKLIHLMKVWSFNPRSQPIRPSPDGNGTQFGAVRDPKTRTLRNRTMLGVIEIERFDLCDATVAFEQAHGQLNVCAVGSAVARGEIELAAKTQIAKRAALAKTKYHNKQSAAQDPAAADSSTQITAAEMVYTAHPNRLRVDVLAARNLDAAVQLHRASNGSDGKKKRRITLRGVATTIVTAGVNNLATNEGPPSTFAKVVIRDKNRRSRTILRNSNPSYAYEPGAIAVSDPSTVIHVAIYTEGAFGNMLIGQFATTLKQLCLEPERADGGEAIDVRVGDDYLEFDAWCPLRDAKWRPFDIPEFLHMDRGGDGTKGTTFTDVSFRRHNSSSGITSIFAGRRLSFRSAGTTTTTGSTSHSTVREPLVSSSSEAAAENDDDEDDDDGKEEIEDLSLHDPLQVSIERRSAPVTTTLKTAASLRQNYGKDSSLSKEPSPNYPAVRLRLRWDYLQGVDDDSRQLTAMEHMKINSAETAARCGNIDNIRAMLATFPFWLDCRGGFKIRGEAVAHVRDLFMGAQGSLEKQRTKRGGTLLDKDWRHADRQAIKLSKIEVAFPCADTVLDYDDDNNYFRIDGLTSLFKPPVVSYPEKNGFLTLDGAMVELVRGIFARILASGRVGATILQILSAITSGSFSQNPSTYRANPLAAATGTPGATELSIIQRQRHAAADRQALGVLGLRGTRSDRQFALLMGLIKPSHKRLDARAIDDLVAPVAAAGVLQKSSKHLHSHQKCPNSLDKNIKWHSCRCVLRGATIFYFRVNKASQSRVQDSSGIVMSWQHNRAGEDHVVDLHRLVFDNDGPVARYVRDANGDEVLELKVRRDDGDVYVIYLKEDDLSPPGARVKRIQADAWDEGVYSTIEDGHSSSLADWSCAVVTAVERERARARTEVARMLAEYKSVQSEVHYEHSNSGTYADRLLDHTFPPTLNPQAKASNSRLNGSWNMTRRSAQLDALLAAEGISFGTRMLSSAAPATLYVRLDDAQHCVIYCRDGFFPSRFYGTLNKPTRMLKVADDTTSPEVLAIASLSPDGNTLVLSQASPRHGHIFFKCELHIRDNDTLEQRTRYSHADFSREGILFKKAGDYDLFTRLPPKAALEVELSAM